MQTDIRVVDNVARAATQLFLDQAERALHLRDRFVVVLSGGSTPLVMYEYLVEEAPDAYFWHHTHVFWGDERFVPHDHPDSNYGAAYDALLGHLAIPDHHIHPIPYIADNPAAAARNYATSLTQVLGNSPIVDLTFLGLGDDAHTASLFPGTNAVHADGLVTVVETATKGTRVSLTASTLSHSRTVAFLVTGEKKRRALVDTLGDHQDTDCYPAQAISAQEQLIWLTDIQL